MSEKLKEYRKKLADRVNELSWHINSLGKFSREAYEKTCMEIDLHKHTIRKLNEIERELRNE